MILKERWQSKDYSPERVTGRYVRKNSRSFGEGYRVFEAADGTLGRFKGRPGMGPTIREYDVDGSEFSEAFRAELADYGTRKWE